MEGQGQEPDEPPQRPPYLRLVWSNPHPPLPRRPVDLAMAIQRHLEGGFGLTDQDFVRIFACTSLSPR